jgi:hypothetical protein
MKPDTDRSAPAPDEPPATRQEHLHAALLRAHLHGDLTDLVTLYSEAGKQALDAGRIDAACFYLTHARVFAMEAGDRREGALRALLCAYGREH